MDDKYVKLLKEKYQTPYFETKKRPVSEFKDIISDEDLVAIIKINNQEIEECMAASVIDKERIKRLVYANINFYNLANRRKMSIPGENIVVMGSTYVNIERNYQASRLANELRTQSDEAYKCRR